MSNSNKVDDVENWLHNDATLEEIEAIANGEKVLPMQGDV